MLKVDAVIKRMPAAERRQQILQKAFELISAQGFKTVSVRDIAHAAGINEALIYKYFPTKAALLSAIAHQVIDRQPVQVLALAQDRAGFARQLQAFVDFFLKSTAGDASIPKIILYAVLEGFPLPDEFNYQKEGGFLNWLYCSIEKGKLEWGFNPHLDALVALSSFMGGLIYFVLQAEVVKLFPASARVNFQSGYVDLFLKSLQ